MDSQRDTIIPRHHQSIKQFQESRENTDVVGDKPVKNDAGDMSMSKDSKQKAWLEQRLLNIEFDWDPDHLSYQPPVEGTPIPIITDMVKKAISQMKACGWPHQTVGVNRQFPVWLRPRQRHYRRNLCCQAAAKKYLAANKRLYMAFVDLEKAFDQVPQKVIWWALRKLGVEEWIVQPVQGMYANAWSHVRVGEGYSEEFEVKVGVHQGSVLSPLLFIIVLEALSREFCSGVPWEDLYANDLFIIAESIEECVRRLLTWKDAMEKKELRVNAGKTKIMICCMGLDLLQSSGELTCAVCRSGVGSNSIFCDGCKHWVHKKCSGL